MNTKYQSKDHWSLRIIGYTALIAYSLLIAYACAKGVL